MVAAYVYRDEFVTLHRLLKFSGQESLFAPLGDRMSRALLAREIPPPELVVALPPDPLRWGPRRRVSRRLARMVSRSLGLPSRPRALRKRRSTRSQTRRTREERSLALQGVFTADAQALHGRRVLLVDDVATTLATLSDASRALREAGAREIIALVLARTPRALS